MVLKQWKLDKLLVCYLISVVLVALIAVLSGFYTSEYVNNSELELTISRFKQSSSYRLGILDNLFSIRFQGMVALTRMMNYFHPNMEDWPNVVMPGFYDISSKFRIVLSVDNVAFVPLVLPDQLPQFESFMYEYFESEPAILPGTGNHSFGKGVYATDRNNQTYHDTTGMTLNFFSPNRILTPVLQLLTSNGTNSSQYTYNIHSNPRIGSAIDRIIECSVGAVSFSSAIQHCGWIANSLPLPAVPSAPNLAPTDFASAALQPIYLERNASRLVGFIGTAVSWYNILQQIFVGYVDYECVIRSENVTFTYSLSSPNFELKGLGDLSNPRYKTFGQQIELTANAQTIPVSQRSTVSLYPTAAYIRRYRTNKGTYIGVVVGLVVVFLGGIFLLRDFVIRRETRYKEEMLNSKRKFVRFISHEIRTPLNSVHLGLELLVVELKNQAILLDNDSLPSPQVIETIRVDVCSWLDLTADLMGNSESAVDVLNDLLNYDKIEMGTLRLDFTAVSIWPLVEKSARTFTMQAKQKDICLDIHGALWDKATLLTAENMDARSLVVISDSSRIAQIMRNLLSNALKFTPTSGTVTVTAEWQPNGLPGVAAPEVTSDKTDLLDLPRAGSILVSVRDTGVGLSESQLGEICSEGVQFNANTLQAGKGSGLGLYISRGLAEQHGGSLTVSSEGLGKGSVFRLELPLSRKAVLSAPFNASSTTALPGGTDYTSSPTTGTYIHGPDSGHLPGTRRILVVDDAPSNRKMLIRLLKARGYECEQAEDGQQAIDLYLSLVERGEAPDTIVMDYEMPVMDGPSATKKLREVGCQTLIVGVTGNLLPDDVDHFKRQGANAVLGKPLNVKVFEDIVQEFRASNEKQILEGRDVLDRKDLQQELADEVARVISDVPVHHHAMRCVDHRKVQFVDDQPECKDSYGMDFV